MSKRSIITTIIISVLLISVLVIVIINNKQEYPGELVLTQNKVNFGTIPEWEGVVTRSVTARNAGRSPLRIERIQTGCSYAEITGTELIPPNEEVTLMKTKNIRSLRKFINIFNPVAGKKQLIVKNLLYFVLFSIFLSGHSYAGTWQDTFNGDELKGWERTAEHNIWNAQWEVVEGLLFSRVQTHGAEGCGKNTADFLHWNAHQFKLDQLEVIGTKINYPQEGQNGMGELCLFLGKKLHNADFAVEGYIFSPEETSKVTFSKKNDYSRGKPEAWYGNKFPFTTQHLKVVFVSGEFHLFTNGVLLAQFADDHFMEIDVVGLLITCHFDGQWFGANISSFSVSGNGIPNHNLAVQLGSTQLTTIWGR